MDNSLLLLSATAAGLLCLIGFIAQRNLTRWREKVAVLQANNQHLQTTAQQWETRWQAGEQARLALQNDCTALHADKARLLAAQQERDTQHQHYQEQLAQQQTTLKETFHHLAQQIFDAKDKTFNQNSQTCLESVIKPLQEQIDRFQKRVNDVHSDTIKGNTQLEAEIKQIVDIGLKMRDEASHLTQALKGNNKIVGHWGEAQLEKTLQLAGLVAGDHYAREVTLKDNNGNDRRPDFIVNMPDEKHIVIDSKMSLLNYEQAIAAPTQAEQQQAMDAHIKSMHRHIDGLAKKNYSHLPGLQSPHFVFMFIPIEPAYIASMQHKPSLFNEAYHKGVVLVSHTTLMPLLRVVANLWALANHSQEVRDIASKAGDIYHQVCLVTERLQQLGGTLGTANKHYNSILTALNGQRGLHNKVSHFKQLSRQAAQAAMPAIEPLPTDDATVEGTSTPM